MRYICTHKDFDSSIFTNGIIISSNQLNNQYNLPIIYANNKLLSLKHSYSEGYMIYDIYEKDNTSDYIEINHYRRYFEQTDINDEIILPIPLKTNLLMQFIYGHYAQDILLIFNIIDKYFSSYSLNYKDINVIFPCNMFKMRHEYFNEYCNFVFSILNIFSEKMEFKNDEDIKKYTASHFPENLVEYHSRLHGFLMERIGTIFFLNYFKNKSVKYQNIIKI